MFHLVQKRVLFPVSTSVTLPFTGSVLVRELSKNEMVRAENELWVHYHQQKADLTTDRLFAAFAGNQLGWGCAVLPSSGRTRS